MHSQQIQPVPATDADAIRASCADPAQFAVIFDRHFESIYRYLYRRIGLPLADDLVADTFTTAFVQRGGYDCSRPDAGPWLYGIAANLLRRHRRAEERRLRAYARSAAAAGSEMDLAAVADRVDASSVSGQLAAALAALSSSDREVLLLYAWADLSYAEIGVAMDVPIGTVRSRLNRARVKVRQHLGLAIPPGEGTTAKSEQSQEISNG